MAKTELYPFFLEPTIKNYIWGGRKFRHFLREIHNPNVPIAEIWAIFDENKILNGSLSGRTINEVVHLYGNSLLGSNAPANCDKFPLLIKLLDSQQWLSVQVHPKDQEAVQMEGPGFKGKTEGWYVIDADPGSQLIAGVTPEVSMEEVTQTIRTGTITSLLQYHTIEKDNFILIPAGTIHALGPGAVIYEIQQNSDVTYRVFDWDRPASAGRQLHIEKSIAVTDLNLEIKLHQAKDLLTQNIFLCEYFSLDLHRSNNQSLDFNPNGDSFHAITVIEGTAHLNSTNHQVPIQQFESVLVPADYQPYQLTGNFKVLIGRLNKI